MNAMLLTHGIDRVGFLWHSMSLAGDAVEFLRIFNNGRDVPAQSPIPPGIFGYDPAYTNPYRKPDLERARALAAGRPAVIEVVTDPEVPPLPPHITMQQAKAMMFALAKGDPARGDVVRQSLKEKVAEFLPGR